MRKRAFLPLMEQAVMILVFALAAALCLRPFVWADGYSTRQQARDHAIVAAQRAAETLKAIGQTDGGDMAHTLTQAVQLVGGEAAQGIWYIGYDENWNQTADTGKEVYRLCVQGEPAPVEGMWQARVWVDVLEDIRVGGTYNGPLFSLTVAWQEVASYG